MKRIITALVLTIMICLTAIAFMPSFSRFLMAGGSDSTMTANNGAKLYQVLAIGGCILLSIYCKYERLRWGWVIFVGLVLFWFFSGRTVGAFPDGRLNTGWFSLRFEQYRFCPIEATGCDEILAAQTLIEEDFWGVTISNRYTTAFIFTGPFAHDAIVQTLKSSYVSSAGADQ